MSILKSTISGRYKVISEYLKKNYSEVDSFDGRPKVEYEIWEGKDDYTVKLKPKIQGTIINVHGETFPCKMVFDNRPYVVFDWFTTPKQFELIDKHFYINCRHYIFRTCAISCEHQEKFLMHNYKHISWSSIYIEENFFTEILPKYNVNAIDFIDHMIENDNTLFIKEYDIEYRTHPIYSDFSYPRTYTYKEIDKEELKRAKRHLQEYKF